MAAPKTVLTYPLNGSKDFTIPFEYLARKFVVVTLRGSTRRTLVLNSEYRFSTKNTITTNTVWGAAQGFDSIELRRVTSATERLVDFSDGSILRAYDLNTSQIQSLHIAEEGRDIATDTIGVDNNGQLDARARRIVNLADAVDPGDAVTLRQQQQWAGSALNQANRAEAQANLSAGSANAAAFHAGAAKTSEDNSLQYAQLAWQHKESAAASATAANDSRALAQLWAVQNEDTPVQPGLFSAYHYSRKAAKSAEWSNREAVSSQQSAATSLAQASRATTEADRAKTEADKLGNMNGIAALLESTTAQTLKLKDGHAVNTPVVYTDYIYSRTPANPVAIDDNLQVSGYASIGTTIVAGQTINALGGLYDSGQRAWSALNFNPATKYTVTTGSAGINNAASGDLYQNFTVEQQVYNSALEIRENGRVGSGGPWPLHEYNAPALTFHWGAAYVQKLFMTSDGYLNWGNHLDRQVRIATNGNLWGSVWGGWISSYLSSTYVDKAGLMGEIANRLDGSSIGSISMFQNVTGQNLGLGNVSGGGGLRYSSHNNPSGSAPAGSWRSIGWANNGGVSLWIRYA